MLYQVGEETRAPSAQAPASQNVRPASPASLGTLPEGATEMPVFASPSGEPMVLTEEFNVKFKESVSRRQIEDFNASNKVRMVRESKWEKNFCVLAVQKEAGVDALAMANRYHESGLALYAEPNFLQRMTPHNVPNDPMFPQQWSFRNTGQDGRGIPGQDIKAVEAWGITRGSPNICIAVLDEGVDYAHPDFNAPGKLATGYDSIEQDNAPRLNAWDDHGTACAGIATAVIDNGLGVAGVAPHCRLMGIRIAYSPFAGANYWITSSDIIADGINAAVALGADVLNNSWGGGAVSNAITGAIRNAKNNGRQGRGCVVCFAAGNGNGPIVYPATLPEVFVVSACNPWGRRKTPTSQDGEWWWGSSFGPEVDVCAPGVFIRTTTNGGGYLVDFNGTSSSCPHVAGVAALVLSLNPQLTAPQVEEILRNSTDDLETPGYDIYTGHGRINAFKAVQSVTPSNRSRLNIGERLSPGEALVSPNGQYRLVMQPYGSLELLNATGSILWTSFTPGNAGAYAEMLMDGNLVVRTPTRVIWMSITVGSGATYTQIENGGFFALYRANDSIVRRIP